MSARRHLVVNADDLGYSAGVNRGIFEAHRAGIVTSASLMVRRPAAAAAAAGAPPELGLGLHLDLGEWVFDQGWHARDVVVAADDGEAVAAELARQVARFRDLVGHDPTHLDSHQHVHRNEPVRTVVLTLGRELGVPVRHESSVRYCGEFYGQDDEGRPHPELLRPERLEALIRALPDGATELCCHPGYADGLASTYAAEREQELASLCDPRLPALLVHEQIELVSFAGLPGNTAA